MHGSSAGAFHANDAMRVTAGATAARMATRHARLGGGVSWRECHGLDAGGRGQAGAFTAPAPIFPRRSRRGRYDSAPAVPQEKGDEALALAQLFSRCLHVARRACGDHGAVDLVQCRGGVLSSVRVTMGWGITVLRHWPRIRIGCRLPAGAIVAWSTWVPSQGCRRAAPAPGHAAAMAVPPPASGVVNGACSARCPRRARGRPWRNTGVARHARGFDGARRYCGGCALQRAGSVAGLSPSRRRAHRVPTNADGRVSRCRRRGPRIR